MQYEDTTATEARASLIKRGLLRKATSPNTFASWPFRPEMGDQACASANDDNGHDKDSRNS